MDEKTFTFAWEVKNYSLRTIEAPVLFKSNIFVPENLKDTEWMVYLYSSKESNDILSFFLKRCDSGPDSVPLQATVQLIAVDGKPANKTTHTANIPKDHGMISYNFVSTRRLERLYLHNDTLKIQCILRTNKKIETNRIYALTSCDVRKISKEWVLTNFSQVRHGILLESVRLQEGSKLLFDVRLSIQGRRGKTAVLIQFTRRGVYPAGNQLSLNALITLLDAQGKGSEIWKKDQHVFDLQTPEEVWLFPSFLSKANLVKQKKKYLMNDVLKLKCEITVSWEEMTSKIEESSFTEETSDTQLVDSLTKDMNVLYDKKLFADVELRVCEERVPANRFILHLRSKKFAEMLDDIGGTDNAILDVPDVDIITLKRMLKFIYTDEIDDLEYDDAVLAYVAAHKYEIESLKWKYSFVLQSHLKVSNVCSILEFADNFYDQNLKNCAFEFIKQYWDRVGLSEKWDALSKKRLFLVKEVKEVLRRTQVVKHSTNYQ